MKVTTLRFGEDLWSLLEKEAAAAGVSVSQYVREAALARAAASAGARGDNPFEGLAGSARAVMAAAGGSVARRHEVELALAALARALAADQRDSSTALHGESAQRTKKADDLRARAASMRPG